MSESILTKHQEKIFYGTIPAPWNKSGFEKITVTARWDDSCDNGHNELAVTGETKDTSGCIHADILRAEGIPVEIKALIPFHLCSSVQPMHYIANTLYLAKGGDLMAAREMAVADWSEEDPLWIPDEDLSNEAVLLARLPLIMAELEKRVVAAGFVW